MNDEIKRLLQNYKQKEKNSIEEWNDWVGFSSVSKYRKKVKEEIAKHKKEIDDIDKILSELD